MVPDLASMKNGIAKHVMRMRLTGASAYVKQHPLQITQYMLEDADYTQFKQSLLSIF